MQAMLEWEVSVIVTVAMERPATHQACTATVLSGVLVLVWRRGEVRPRQVSSWGLLPAKAVEAWSLRLVCLVLVRM